MHGCIDGSLGSSHRDNQKPLFIPSHLHRNIPLGLYDCASLFYPPFFLERAQWESEVKRFPLTGQVDCSGLPIQVSMGTNIEDSLALPLLGSAVIYHDDYCLPYIRHRRRSL